MSVQVGEAETSVYLALSAVGFRAAAFHCGHHTPEQLSSLSPELFTKLSWENINQLMPV